MKLRNSTNDQTVQERINLWRMPKESFNKWRQQNDLPKLVSFFQTFLPHFDEWLNDQNITTQQIILADSQSEFLGSDGPKYLSTLYGLIDGGPKIGESTAILNRSKKEYEKYQKKRFGKILFEVRDSKKFLPYLFWLKNKKKIYYFQLVGEKTKQDFYENFVYNSWEGMVSGGSKAFLMRKFPVLGLGGVRINANFFDGRNLDFVNLDGLSVHGTGWANETTISYSSCRNISFLNVEKSFIHFVNCELENFSAKNCRLQDLHFITSTIRSAFFEHTRLFRTNFYKATPFNVNFINCDITDLFFTKPHFMNNKSTSDFYRRVRMAFQTKGIRQESSQYYYLERYHEMLSSVFPLIPRINGFPVRYSDSYKSFFFRWKAGQYTTKQILKFLGNNFLFYIKIFLNPLHLGKLVLNRVNSLVHILDYSIWGFGERPARIFIWIFSIIALFTSRYYFSSIPEVQGNVEESFYCSLFNFVTVGCNYKSGIDSFESLIGAVLLAILVAGFANKSKY